jgi:integrase
MRERFYIYRRRGIYYLQDSRSGKQQSLDTTEKKEALRLLEIKRQATESSTFNQIMLKTCLTTQDPLLAIRTWQNVMDQMKTHGRASTRLRCDRAMRSKELSSLKNIKLIETTAEDFLKLLRDPSHSVAHYLKRLHNLAVGLGWLSFPVLAPRLWPKLRAKPKRGITAVEHEKILAAEKNPERNLFYRLLWEIGSSQSDAAALTAENIDWATNCLSYNRSKTGELAQIAIGKSLAALMKELPTQGPFFPTISQTPPNARAAEFYRRCKLLKIEGVSLHSYRYAWAERAKSCGYPERFAQEALGHNSKAVHRAYARRALVMIPPMEDYQNKMATIANTIVAMKDATPAETPTPQPAPAVAA